MAMSEKATLIIDGNTYELPIVTGTEGGKSHRYFRVIKENRIYYS